MTASDNKNIEVHNCRVQTLKSQGHGINTT